MTSTRTARARSVQRTASAGGVAALLAATMMFPFSTTVTAAPTPTKNFPCVQPTAEVPNPTTTYVLPPGTRSIQVRVAGAGGHDGAHNVADGETWAQGGRGAVVTATVENLPENAVLRVYVGCDGANDGRLGGYGRHRGADGGEGDDGGSRGGEDGGGGGGSSAIALLESIDASNEQRIVEAGGGGGGGGDSGTTGNNGGTGGAGSQNGEKGDDSGAAGGAGGTQLDGNGSAGTNAGALSWSGGGGGGGGGCRGGSGGGAQATNQGGGGGGGGSSCVSTASIGDTTVTVSKVTYTSEQVGAGTVSISANLLQADVGTQASYFDGNVNGRPDAGETVTFTATVTNNGSTAVSGLSMAPGTYSCGETTLLSGAQTTCNSFYPLTQADIDKGSLTRTATATASTANGTPVTSNTLQDGLSLPDASGITPAFTTDAISSPVPKAGTDKVAYTYTITNSGNTTLSDVTIVVAEKNSGATLAGSCTAAPGTGAIDDGRYPPGLRLECSAEYPLKQSDVDAGTVTGTAEVTAKRPNGTAVEGAAERTTAVPRQSSATATVAGSVEDTNGTQRTDAGDTAVFVVTGANSGNTTLNDFRITGALDAPNEPKPALSCTPEELSSIAPAQSMICTARHVIDQADMEKGSLTYEATASGTPPGGDTVSSPLDAKPVNLDPSIGMTITKSQKSIEDVNKNDKDDTGDVITYEFLVKNTGTVVITEVTVTDPLATVQCPSGVSFALNPGLTETCTAEYVVKVEDVNSGKVTNTATARGKAKGEDLDQDSNTVETQLDQVDGVEVTAVVERVLDSNFNGANDVNDRIFYSFSAANSGGTTLSDATLSASVAGGGTLEFNCTTPMPAALAPGEKLSCTGSHLITAADVTAKQVSVTASLTATGATGPVNKTSTAGPTPTQAAPETTSATTTPPPSGSRAASTSAAPGASGVATTGGSVTPLASTGADTRATLALGGTAVAIGAGLLLLLSRQRRQGG